VADAADAHRIAGFYRQRWTIEQLFRTLKTQGFDVEALRLAAGGPFEKLVAASLLAAVTVLQLVHERDGAAKRPLEDAFDSQDRLALEAISASLEGKTARQKTPIPRATSLSPPGSSHAWVAGPGTMASQGPSSCSKASSNFKPLNMDGACEMYESGRVAPEGHNGEETPG
jgi:hypothetical protein